MGMSYKGLEKFADNLRFLYSADKPRDIKLFLIAKDEKVGCDACDSLKKILEEFFEEGKLAGLIDGYEVPVIDLLATSEKNGVNYLYQFRGTSRRPIFPIFANADTYSHLPQEAFDLLLPVAFAMSREAYWKVRNGSKRECYDQIELG